MLYLYVSTYCPYCHKVKMYLDEAEVPYEIRNVQEKQTYREDVIRLGGKMQVPLLLDTGLDVSMYESDDIIAHVAKHYAQGSASTT